MSDICPEDDGPPGSLPSLSQGHRYRAAVGTGEEAAGAVRRVTDALPDGEERPGQVAMAAAVASAIESGRHLCVQAGTGTGKTLGYLVPALLSGKRTVVATATKALQEQLIGRDLPFLASALGRPFTAALLKGRSNYLCRAALADTVGSEQGRLVGEQPRVAELAAWAAETGTGDRSDLPFSVSNAEWSAVSVSVGECPGRAKCPHGDVCFAEQARDAAAEADLVVVNTHLYGLHLASGGAVLPEHDVVVVDEAHALEDIAADTLGLRLGPGRFENLARAMRGVFTADHPAVATVDAAGVRLGLVLEGLAGRRVEPSEGDLGVVLVGCATAVATAMEAARGLDVGGDAASRRDRLTQLGIGLSGDLHALAEPDERRVVWVEGGAVPVLRVAPVDVGVELAGRLFANVTAVLTSATLAVGGSFDPVAERLGLPAGEWDGIDVGSPFDHEGSALLYCAAHLPDPRADAWEAAAHAEIESLVRAAGGRTLALFTSRRAMEAAASALRDRLPFEVLVQDELPRPVLHERFLEDETSVLFATQGFWQGFDAPGPTCSLVIIDRLPFARPDDPLAVARREAATRARRNAFSAVDLPAAAVLLAQGAGRLVRTATDRGVVAVLDRRLATASYRWPLVRSLPPMRRTKDPAEARAFLAELAAARPAA
jgi:ATP-dependent DNA helicase DinG